MESALQVIRERRSVRRYTDDPVDDATLDVLLEAAIWAPSAVNAQPWSFGMIRDRTLLERYAERAKAIYLAVPPVGELAATPEPVLRHLREVLAQPGYDVFHGAGEVKAELGVPESVVAALPMVVGHPAEQPHPTTRNPPRVLYRR
ncbi:MAG TPA: nitroreductase family protein [Acidimicrobiia bacterium]